MLPAVRLSVVCLSVTLVGPTQGIEIFGNISTVLGTLATPLLEFTCYMGSYSVTCHPAEVIFQPLPQPKLVLDLATQRDAKLI